MECGGLLIGICSLDSYTNYNNNSVRLSRKGDLRGTYPPQVSARLRGGTELSPPQVSARLRGGTELSQALRGWWIY